MRWIDRLPLALAITLLGTSGAIAQIIVVRSAGPSAARFRPGTPVAANAPLPLKAGDVLTLLDESGSWTVRGPRNLLPKAQIQPAAASQVLAVNDRRARIGAVRGVGDAAGKRPNLWLVDVAQGGPVCFVGPAAPTLWRADTKAATTMTVSGPSGSATVDWAVGQDNAAWPTTLPASGSYRLATGGKTVDVALKPLASAPATPADTGKALIGEGCQAQVDLLVEEVGTPDAGS